jgi:iron complex outermembrane receptor protein
MENESKAVYGQFTYDATDRLSVTVGLRYTEDEKTLILSQKDPRLQGTTAATSATEDWSKFTSALTFDYIVNDDINVYAKVSEGFAAGIFNPGTVGVSGDTTSALTPADPEELTSYEIGMKSRLFDNRVQLNGAIFYNDSDNLQTTDFVGGVRQTLNTGGSQSKGIELELIAMLTDNLLINANYGYNDTEANDFTDPSTGDVKARYVTAPHNTGAVGIQHDLPLDFGLLTSRLDVTYTDRQGYSASDKRVEGDERTLVNARVGLSEVVVPGGDITVALWGRNLTDEEYIQHGANYGSFVGFAWGEPRSYGVDVTYNF